MPILAQLITIALAAAPAPRSATSEALLLGVSNPELATYLIDRDGPVRLGRGLAVPGGTGWYVVDVSPAFATEELEDDFAGGKRVHKTTSSELWAKPLASGRPPWWKAGWKSKAVRKATEELSAGCEDTQSTSITLATPALLSLRAFSSSDCGAHPTDWDAPRVVSLSRLPEEVPVSLEQVLAASQKEALEKGAEAARQKEECAGALDLGNWGIQRMKGAWSAAVELERSAEACRGVELPSLPLENLSPKITGLSPAGRDLAAIWKQYPDAVDAFASPSGRTTVVIRRESVTVLVEGEPARDFRIPLNGSFVMAEWATTPASIKRWRKEAQAALVP